MPPELAIAINVTPQRHKDAEDVIRDSLVPKLEPGNENFTALDFWRRRKEAIRMY